MASIHVERKAEASKNFMEKVDKKIHNSSLKRVLLLKMLKLPKNKIIRGIADTRSEVQRWRYIGENNQLNL